MRLFMALAIDRIDILDVMHMTIASRTRPMAHPNPNFEFLLLCLTAFEIVLDDQDQREADQRDAENTIHGGIDRNDHDSIREGAAKCVDLRKLPQRHRCTVDREKSHHVRIMQSDDAQRCVQSNE